MAEENLNFSEQNIEFHLVTIFEKLESMRNESLENTAKAKTRVAVEVEVRSLELWRSVFSECMASFVYIFVVCGAAASSGVGASTSSMLLATALASGFAMTSLTQCFGHISGAHVNPAVSIAMGVTKHISILRTVLFVIAQCGGGIAGAAFLYSVTIPGYQANLATTLSHSSSVSPLERFGVELILTFIVVFSHFASMESYRKWMSSSAITIGATYTACSFVSMPYLNPARSLGPALVLNKYDHHYVYWLGPILGGIASGLTHEYIFNAKRHKRLRESTDGDSSSINSDEDTYDDLDRQNVPKFHGSTYNTYRAASTMNGPTGYCPSLTSASLYSAPPAKLERAESLYGGTKSLFTKSPPLTRANLNRSQSVCTKSNSNVNRDIIPKPGPLVPAQSLYPMRLNPQTHVQNQNVQNTIHQRSEIYGVRGITPGTTQRSDNYGTVERTVYREKNYDSSSKYDATSKYDKEPQKGRRPDSMYGMVSSQRRGQSAQSDDSTYGSYHGAQNGSNISGQTSRNTSNNYSPPVYPSKGGQAVNSFAPRNIPTADGVRQSPPAQLLATSNGTSYHHTVQPHSPNAQY